LVKNFSLKNQDWLSLTNSPLHFIFQKIIKIIKHHMPVHSYKFKLNIQNQNPLTNPGYTDNVWCSQSFLHWIESFL